LAGRAGLKEVFACISSHAGRALGDKRDAHWATAKDYMQQTALIQADGPPPTASSATKAHGKTATAPKMVDRRSTAIGKSPSASSMGMVSGQQTRDPGPSAGGGAAGSVTSTSRRSAMPRMMGRASTAALQPESAPRRQTTNIAKHRASSPPPPLDDESLTSSSKPSTPMVTPAQRTAPKLGRLQQDPEGRRELHSYSTSSARTPQPVAVPQQVASSGGDFNTACDPSRLGEIAQTTAEEAEEEQAPGDEAELEALSEFETSPGVPAPGGEDGEEPALHVVGEAEDAVDIQVLGDDAPTHPAEQGSLPETHHFAENAADGAGEQSPEQEEDDDEVW